MATPPTSKENFLGPYRLVRKLGEGGMGTVYLGYDGDLDRRVAIKVLRTAQNLEDDKIAAAWTRRFLREARSAARINHPNVVTIHSVGQQRGAGTGGGEPYLVMEYVDGGSLAEHLYKSGPMHWRDAARAVRDALRGLSAAHAKGVIHRDIKPANLMRARDHDGEEIIKLVDFGLARVVTGPAGDPDLTFPGAFVGSPSYCSPEQVAGAALLDGRADLYSLAAAWYALLTGQPPFIEEDPADILEHHLRDPFPDVRRLAPDVPAAVYDVIRRASRKKPDERYMGAIDMYAAVEALLLIPCDPTPATAIKASHAAITAPAGRAEETVMELESRLANARAKSDTPTQLATLRTLYGLYAQLDRRNEATRAYREALVVHIKMQAPGNN